MPVKKLNGYPLKKPRFSNELPLGDKPDGMASLTAYGFRNRVSYFKSRYCGKSDRRNPVSWFVTKARSLMASETGFLILNLGIVAKATENPVSWFGAKARSLFYFSPCDRSAGEIPPNPP
jgi:hypothetical protein